MCSENYVLNEIARFAQATGPLGDKSDADFRRLLAPLAQPTSNIMQLLWYLLRSIFKQLVVAESPGKTGPFFEFSLCLFRACLGKMMIFSIKWRKNGEFESEISFRNLSSP
jgi:hypothetical protein